MNFTAFAEFLFGQVLAATLAASILAALVWGLQALFGKHLSPGWRHALWLLVLVRFLVPVLPESRLSIFNAPQWVRAPVASPQVKVTFPDVLVPGIDGLTPDLAAGPDLLSKADAPSPARLTWFQGIAWLWLAVSVALLLRLALASCWLRWRVRRTAEPIEPARLHLFCETRSRLRTCWNPRLIQSSAIVSPGLFGCFRPKLLLPPGVLQRLSNQEMCYVFLHELAHLKRADLWINLFMSIAHAAHWFNPLVWLVLRRLRLERELACDALALRLSEPRERHAYGETILKLLEDIQPRATLPAVVGIMEEKQSASSRLRQIHEFTDRKPRRLVGFALLASVALVGLSNAQSTLDQTGVPRSAAADDANLPPPHLRGVEILTREYSQQRAVVERQQKELEKIRVELNLSASDEFHLAAVASESARAIERDRISAQARYVHFRKLHDELKPRRRTELRKIIPTVAPDAAMDRYFGDLAKVEQQYAEKIHDFGPEHPEVMRLVELMKTINQQIEDRIDGVLAGIELQVTQTKALVDELSRRTREVDASRPEQRYFTAKRELENQQRILDTLLMRLLAEKVDSASAERFPVLDSTILRDARLLMEMNHLDEAELKLKKIQSEPEKLHAEHYLKLIHERRQRESLTQDKQSDHTSSGVDQAPSEPLYTRTFKLDLRTFTANVQKLTGKQVESSNLLEAFRQQLTSAGVDLSQSGTNQQQKAVFLNTNTGILMARATLADLGKVETLLQILNTPPPQVLIETHILELKPGAAYEQSLLLRSIATNKAGAVATLAGLLTDSQFNEVVAALEGRQAARAEHSGTLFGTLTTHDFAPLLQKLRAAEGVSLLAAPKVTTLSHRQARIAIDPGPTVDVLPILHEVENLVSLDATVEIPEQKSTRGPITGSVSAQVRNGETLILIPPQSGETSIIIFLTPTAIDAAGNRKN